MGKPTNISHPLKHRPGTSQRTRIIEALNPDSAPIDGKTLADQLYLISEYARQINYYEFHSSQIEGEYQEIGDWFLFFKNSLPFQLARFGKTSIEDLEDEFNLLAHELLANPSKEGLEAILEFIFNELIEPVKLLYEIVDEAKSSYKVQLRAIIKSSFIEALKCYIGVYNAGVTFFCICKKDFTGFLNSPWQLSVKEVYDIDACIKKVKKGKKEALIKATELLTTVFLQLSNGLRDIVAAAPNYIEESLLPLEESLQKKHEPHLALLFSFLELFKHFRNNLNDLGKKHLDFFYQQVLKLEPKAAVPDKAHVIFELAKHLDTYALKEDLLVKNGKDVNKQDIHFGLDHEIVLDKAQIKEVRSLSLYPVQDGQESYLEGIYTAPVANSMDGLGKKFNGDQSNNWVTLGSKYSKFIQEGNELAEEHPKAQLGFVLASPVLLLQEGKRTIGLNLKTNFLPPTDLTYLQIAGKLTIPKTKEVYRITQFAIDQCQKSVPEEDRLSLTAQSHLNKVLIANSPFEIDKTDLDLFLSARDEVSCLPVFKEKDKNLLKNCLVTEVVENEPLFNLKFSGENEWLVPSTKQITTTVGSNGSGLDFNIKIELKADFPPIVFYDEEVLQENLDIKQPFPLVIVELNQEVKISCDSLPGSEIHCCLADQKGVGDSLFLSPYYFLREAILEEADIEVEVCGVKNLIVQNDDNLQDVNRPIQPFGPRPKVGDGWFAEGGANFYIGSKEIFCKNWRKIWINTTWKDKPDSLEDHYEFYDTEPYEDGSTEIKEGSFRFLTSFLEDGNWRQDLSIKLPSEAPPPNTPPHREYLRLFQSFDSASNPCPKVVNKATYCHGIPNSMPAGAYKPKSMPLEELTPLTVDTRKGFIRMTLAGVSFQHDRYAYVLAEQMMALVDLVDPKSIEEAVKGLIEAEKLCAESGARIDDIDSWLGTLAELQTHIKRVPPPPLFTPIQIPQTVPNDLSPYGLKEIDRSLCERITQIKNKFDINAKAGIPEEPYTPLIKSLSIDYIATAEINDIEIIHLYPFKNTSKCENIEEAPYLFPFFDDEGTLFLGIENITPGGSLSVLFQLAEATADSESDRADINWHYLSNNNWVQLRPGFDIISDHTDGLTVSGIVNIAVPDTISKLGNTIMPDTLYWIKVSAPINARAVAETIGIHTQAAKTSARFNELHDLNRLETPLEAGQISKLVAGDFSVKKVEQLYPSFGGRKPEVSGHFYTRISEHLKHKGRDIMANDYEKIVLEGFPEIYKVKCISHAMALSANLFRRDLEVAPGFVMVAVIPDLTKLVSGDQLEPKAPVSLLEKVATHLRERTSAFARLKVVNPRYEKMDVKVNVRLHRGKSKSFYAQQLKVEITGFLAPWLLGDSEKICFGQQLFFSDLVGFIERLEYVDFIVDIVLKGACNQHGGVIDPLTARSILTAGKICVEIDDEKCPKPKRAIISPELI